MIKRGQSRVAKRGALQRPNRPHNISAEQLAAHFQEGEHNHNHNHNVHEQVVVDDVGFQGEAAQDAAREDEGDTEAEVEDEMEQELQLGSPPPPIHGHIEHHHQHFLSHQQNAMDHVSAANILANGNIAYAAAQAVAEHQNAPHTIPAPQPMVAATDFQPAPPMQQVPAHPQQQSQPQPKSTEEMAHDSGYTNFNIDSQFAKRMARDPAQRVAEQRKHDQDLNLVRRSNVEALFAQIAGIVSPNPCNHCRKGQGPWTLCVLYNGQMMGSCANCWFNASGSRCSFHEKALEKTQMPIPHHGYAPMPVSGPSQTAPEAPMGVGPYGSPAPGAASALSVAFWQSAAGLYSNDAGVKQTVQNALTEVRQANRYQRSLIEVEIAAKQLALKIVQAEEVAAEQPHAYASSAQDAALEEEGT